MSKKCFLHDCPEHAMNIGCLECWPEHLPPDGCRVCAQVVRDTGRNPSDGAWYLMLVFKNSGVLHGPKHFTTEDVEDIGVPQFRFGGGRYDDED